MFERKLEALGYHAYKDFDANKEQQFRSLILWLEDQQIRHYKIEDREKLRDIGSAKWPEAFQKYCDDLSVPIQTTDRLETLEWLLGFAVRLAYGDNKEKYINQTSQSAKNLKTETPLVKSTNPLDNLDFDSQDFKNGVKSLAELLKISSHPNHLVVLEAISSVIAKGIAESSSKENHEGTPFPIMEADLGFDLGDYVLNQAARILRLLYIHDLRDLQTKINECIVSVQNITADPKTDSKLGKVGF